MNHVKPLKSPQHKLLDSSTLFSLVKLVFSSASICPLVEMTDGHNLARYCKRKAIRPGFETRS